MDSDLLSEAGCAQRRPSDGLTQQEPQMTIRMTGTWSETTGHAASDMNGFLLDYQDVTVVR